MQIPASPHDLTTDWLASVLGGQGLEPDSIQSFDLELLGGEQGMTGQLVRLRIRYQHERPELPETLIVKFSAAEPGARAVISALGHYEREVRFYESLSARTPVPTPHCYYSHLDSETGFALLVLEDLARARNGKSIAGCSVDEVTRVLLPSPGCMRRGGSCGAGQRDVAAPAVPGCARSHGGYLQPGLAILSPKVEYPRDPPDQRDGGLDRTEPSGRRDDLVRLRPSDAHPLRRASGQPVLR